jgi:Ni/Fe-hydrogenase subunit HybB-like protein
VGAFDAGVKAIQTLVRIVAYALATSIFFVAVELFTAFYSAIPEHSQPFRYLFVGLEGHTKLVVWMAASALLAMGALVMLILPQVRKRNWLLGLACGAVFVSLWIEKGLGLVITGFIPSPLERITEYTPTAPEIGITLGVWAGGLLVLTFLYRIFVSVRRIAEENSVSFPARDEAEGIGQ